jgi:cysteine-rich repeat protein
MIMVMVNIDCADPTCASEPYCSALEGSELVCGWDSCADGFDNDGDGLIDMDDSTICAAECLSNDDCDDGNPCTDDLCYLATYSCDYSYNTNPCDDGSACTEDDVCSAGICSGTTISCPSEETCFSPGLWYSGLCEDSIGCTTVPTPLETCDGKDNDCDGVIDEGFAVGVACSVGVGECSSTGVNVCTLDGLDVECNATAGTPTAELCDGLDNDCDGVVDNGFIGLGDSCSSGLGECASPGVLVCSLDKTAIECNAIAGVPSTELCDGLDNDCDGTADEDFTDLGDSCTSGINACMMPGFFICSLDGMSTECNATAGTPTAEVCNDGIDNDCDNLTDSEDPDCWICGNGILDSGEECDDGNNINGDGCSSSCTLETCTACYGFEVIAYNPGLMVNGSGIVSNRTNASKALGIPQNDDTLNFVSLGINGSLIIGFENYVLNTGGDDIHIVETSYGSPACSAYPETIHVYGAKNLNGSWEDLGAACQDASFDMGNLNWMKYLKLVDETNATAFSNGDGYDVDGITASVCSEGVCGNSILDSGEECDDGNNINGDGCSSSCTIEPALTIITYAIVCDDESQLPNWGPVLNQKINATTADAFVNASNGTCHFASNWSFQWAYMNATNPGDNIINASDNWTTFGPTNSSGMAITQVYDLLGSDYLWMREVLKAGYYNFTYSENNETDIDNVSAELYCYTDAYHYDNYDRVDNATIGETYYCVAFNAMLPYCGDGELDDGEACDDGNNINGDGCSAGCVVEKEKKEEKKSNTGGRTGAVQGFSFTSSTAPVLAPQAPPTQPAPAVTPPQTTNEPVKTSASGTDEPTPPLTPTGQVTKGSEAPWWIILLILGIIGLIGLFIRKRQKDNE